VHYGPEPYEGHGAHHFAPTAPMDQEHRKLIMAKGQKRSNREIRKPKANKPTATAATSSVLTKGMLAPVSTPKKKG
jgi:hypothetical protein